MAGLAQSRGEWARSAKTQIVFADFAGNLRAQCFASISEHERRAFVRSIERVSSAILRTIPIAVHFGRSVSESWMILR
jgi:hypothetical protein